MIYILIPIGIIIVVIGAHKLLLWNSWRKELMRDEKKHLWWHELEDKAEIERKLSDDPEVIRDLHPKYW